MKRLTLLVVLLVAVVASGFALEVKPSFAISGSGTLTWGIDLDSGDTGFKNSSSADLTVTLMAKDGSDTHAGSGKVFGKITLSNVELYWDDDDGQIFGAPGVEAYLMFGNFQLRVFDHPSMNSGSTVIIEDDLDVAGEIADDILVAETDFVFGAYDTNQGTFLRYNMGDNWVQLDLVSADAWDDAATMSNYAVGAEASFSFKPVAIGVGVFQGLNWAVNPLGAYLSATVTPEGIGHFTAAVDAQYDFTAPGTLTWDVSAGGQLHFNKDGTAYLDAKVYYDPAGVNGLDTAVAFMVPVDTLFGKVNADLTLYYLNATLATQDFVAVGHVGYTLEVSGMAVAPTAWFSFTTTGIGGTAVSTLEVGPQVVVTLAKAPDTTLTLAYASGDLLAATPGFGAITLALGVSY